MRYKFLLKKLKNFSRFGMKPGLDRVKMLLKKLGNPHRGLKVVLVGGTNGKGSVCAYLAGILTTAGYKTGLYTSPHLIDYPERVKINNKNISRRAFAGLLGKILPVANRMLDRPTIFEILTAMAILCFKRNKVDVVVCEVGLGGAYDATNVLDPIVSVITNVELDHIEVLGKSITKIAKDKAGIIRPNSCLVTGDDKKSVLKVLSKRCAKFNTKLITTASQSSTTKHYQQHNLAIVTSCVKVLRRLGFTISPQAQKQGVSKTFWPGRFQIIKKKPLIILDGAHNPSGAKALVASLKARAFPRPAALIFGAINGKDVKSMLKVLLPLFKVMFITGFNYPRALTPQQIVKMAKLPPKTKTYSSPALALAAAQKKGSATIVVCGSLYMIGELTK